MEIAIQDENAVSRANRYIPQKLGAGVKPSLKPKLTTGLSGNTANNLPLRARQESTLDFNKKAALQKQRENAKKLTSGHSVLHGSSQINKENNNSLLQPDGVRKKIQTHKPVLKKTVSLNSLYEPKKVAVVKPAEESLCKLVEEIKIDPTVIDIDKEDVDDEFLLGYYAKDIYKYLLEIEECQMVRENYLTAGHIMTKEMRAMLVDWMFEVQISFRLLSETIQLSIGMLDRFMQNNPSISKGELQLVGSTCIWLAAKYEEIYPPDLSEVIEIAAKTYSGSQVRKMERRIFTALNFSIGRPTPCNFLRRYARVSNSDQVSYTLAKYFVDLSLVSYTLCHVAPSLLSAAALFVALLIRSEAKEEEIWTSSLRYHSQYTLAKILPVAARIARIVLEAARSKFKTVRTKYMDEKKLFGVSVRAETRSPRLAQLIKDNTNN